MKRLIFGAFLLALAGSAYAGTPAIPPTAPPTLNCPGGQFIYQLHGGGAPTCGTPAAGGGTGSNPTATIGAAAVNGTANTFMRSDAAPPLPSTLPALNGSLLTNLNASNLASGTVPAAQLPLATTGAFGAVKPDGTTVTVSGGVISSAGGASGANPTATIGGSAVNGVATTFMRSDAAPALPATLPAISGANLTNLNASAISSGTVPSANLPAATTGALGAVKPDGTTITISGGVISSTGSGSGNALFGTTTGNTANDGVCMANTTVGVADCGFAPAQASAQLSKATSFTVTAAQFLNGDPVLATANLTETFPATSTLSANGIQILQNSGSNTLTIQPNAADAVCPAGTTCGTAGASYALTAGYSAWVQTDGAGHLYVAPFPYTGSGGGSGFPITLGSTSVAASSTTTSIAGLTLTSPTLTTPALGTPSALVLTNATGTPTSIGLANGTGLPISTGVSGLGAGVATALAITHDTSGGVCTVGGGGCASPALVGYGYSSTRAYVGDVLYGTTLTNTNLVAGSVYYTLTSFVPTTAGGSTGPLFTEIGLSVSTSASGNCDLGVYAVSGGLPTGSPIFDVTVSTAATNTYLTASLTGLSGGGWTPTPGTPYAMAVQCSTATAALTAYNTSTVFMNLNKGGFSGTNLTLTNSIISQTGSYGTPGSSLPSAASASYSGAINMPVIAFHL